MILFLFILLIIASPFDIIVCAPLLDPSTAPLLNHNTCSQIKYADSSPPVFNLANLLPVLPGNASQNGYFRTSVGDGQDRVYGLAICLANFNLSSCQNCVQLVVKNLTSDCPNANSAVLWYDHCMVRYSQALFFSVLDTNKTIYSNWGDNETNGGRLESTIYNLINNISDSAANKSEMRFALGQKSYLQNNSTGNTTTIYGLAQCVRDLTAESCSTCLVNFTYTLKSSGAGKTYTGARIAGQSCFIWYDNKPFENMIAVSSPPPGDGGTPPPGNGVTPPPPEDGGRRRHKTIIIVIVVSVMVGLIVIVICFVWRRKRISRSSSIRRSTEYQKLRSDIRVYSIHELKTATQNFSPSKRLGRGGYGEVYQAVMHGKSVAVKRLLKATKENEHELEKELSLVSNIDHPNILKLVGYCFERNQYFFVYEHMPNGSLDKHLKDTAQRQKLNWATRFKIIKEIAQGLSYLHYGLEKRITHVDLKLANILLSKEMTAKIADFDMLRTFDTEETHQSTEKGYGTPGYMAPEVNMMAIRKNYTLKSDIYSFGIMVLEIVTGQGIHTFNKSESDGNLSVSDESLMSFVWNRWNRKKYQEVIDPYLDVQIEHVNDKMVRCIHIGLLCIQHEAAKRPDILDVQKMLNTKEHLPPPSVPGFAREGQSF